MRRESTRAAKSHSQSRSAGRKFHSPQPPKPQGDSRGWDHVATWYDSLVGDEGSDYHRAVIVPCALRLMAPHPGERFVDFCCGQGVFTRQLLDRGASKVLGLDASERLVAAARKRFIHDADINRLRWVVTDATKSHPLLDGSYDGLACLLAMQDLADPSAACASMASALRHGGRAVVIMMHPCFRIPRQSSWGWDEQKKLQYRRLERYTSPLEIPILTHPGKGMGLQTTYHHRPLAYYINALGRNGLFLSACEEILTHRRSQPGPRARGENRAWQEFPLFLALKAIRFREDV